MAKRSSKQPAPATPDQQVKTGETGADVSPANLIASIYARRYGSEAQGVGVTPPGDAPKTRGGRKQD